MNGELGAEDIEALTAICKGGHGLTEKVAAQPLAKEHVPKRGGAEQAVSLDSIFHHKGVNALAENQTLKFASGLTIVYGDNGAGKTGYTRILKQACRARRQETILGNVVITGVAPPKPTVAIKYKVGTDAAAREWTGGDADEFVSRVSIFDTHCAAVYLNERTDVAFLPFGLDLFDKLVRACKAVRARLETEQRALDTNALTSVIAQIPQGTAAAKLVNGITLFTKPEDVQAIARLKPEEQERLTFLERALQDLQANDPQKLMAQLSLRASRVRALADHLRGLETALADEEVTAVFDMRKEGRRKSEEAKRLREATFPQGLLAGTGEEQWKAMWEAARLFSEQQAYQGQGFPVTDGGAKCVLCQQDLGHAATHRLKHFEEFVVSTTEKELRLMRDEFARRRNAFANLKTSTDATEETLKELRLEHDAKAEAISAAISHSEKRRVAIIAALSKNKDLGEDFQALVASSTQAKSIGDEIDARLKSLREAGAADAKKKMSDEAQELRARLVLGKHEKAILDEIENKKKIAAYAQCLDETKPNAITQKSSAVTKAVVSESLKKRFKDELKALEFNHVEVELKEQGGAEGVFYHKLVLTRNPTVNVPKVVSEGEQRCISIAAFFAELSTADDPSGIVFDDPVSSLDFQWRNAVARRLVEESKRRQVIVFTHDVVFLLALKQFAEQMDVKPLDQHIRRQVNGAGVCREELPWLAMRVKDKIGFLKNAWQAVDKKHRNGEQDAYEREAKELYGLLREAWERAVEEVLLGGIVERFRPSVETQRLAPLSDITDDDCKTVKEGMTKSSAWLTGHDHAAAARSPVPAPDELKKDIETLETWVKGINARRVKK
ncbi:MULTISPECIES: AAA family ATPase [unclassified Xanthomonas]|uniref:AAA family ATPase n=1 Tax=Xanthomonas sp. LMG 9002 TaxID=1591158 RepID=UPI001370D04D